MQCQTAVFTQSSSVSFSHITQLLLLSIRSAPNLDWCSWLLIPMCYSPTLAPVGLHKFPSTQPPACPGPTENSWSLSSLPLAWRWCPHLLAYRGIRPRHTLGHLWGHCCFSTKPIILSAHLYTFSLRAPSCYQIKERLARCRQCSQKPKKGAPSC